MKKIILIATTLIYSACATMSPSSDELKQSAQCTVWKEGLLGTKHITVVEGELAQQKMTCWLMDVFLCSYINYTYRPGSNQILSDIPPKDKTIAILEGKKLSVNMKGITVEPFELGADRAIYMLQGPIGPAQKHTVEYNQKCSTRQVALGLLTVVAK